MAISEDVNGQIDRLLHDAEHASGGASFAYAVGHIKPAEELKRKSIRLLNEAKALYLKSPGSIWPESIFSEPSRPGSR